MTEKPPFQAWQEIERKISRGGLTKAEVADLWDCLFLTLPEIEELLEFVRAHAKQPFIYPARFRQPGQAVSRDSLAASVWPPHIGNLRDG
jgi:hypothetical protein